MTLVFNMSKMIDDDENHPDKLHPGKRKVKTVEPKKKNSDSIFVRSYCRVCNRYYFYKHGFETKSMQIHQHHSGICQGCGYICARINAKENN